MIQYLENKNIQHNNQKIKQTTKNPPNFPTNITHSKMRVIGLVFILECRMSKKLVLFHFGHNVVLNIL